MTRIPVSEAASKRTLPKYNVGDYVEVDGEQTGKIVCREYDTKQQTWLYDVEYSLPHYYLPEERLELNE